MISVFYGFSFSGTSFLLINQLFTIQLFNQSNIDIFVILSFLISSLPYKTFVKYDEV